MAVGSGVRELSWSVSRHRAFAECARLYFYRYYAAPAGRRADAPAPLRRAYTLNLLVTPEIVLGDAVHACAADVAEQLVRGRRKPEAAALFDRVRAILNRVWCSSRDREAFVRRPTPGTMLRQAFYGTPPVGARVAEIRHRMEQCLNNLLDCPIWDEVVDCPPHCVRTYRRPLTTRLADTLVSFVPDLVFRRRGGPVTVVDWKTGAAGDAELQHGVYAAALSAMARRPLHPEGIRSITVSLGGRSRLEHPHTPESQARVHEIVRTSAEEMNSLLTGPADQGVPGEDAFPPTGDSVQCARCNFRELCPRGGEAARPPPDARLASGPGRAVPMPRL